MKGLNLLRNDENKEVMGMPLFLNNLEFVDALAERIDEDTVYKRFWNGQYGRPSNLYFSEMTKYFIVAKGFLFVFTITNFVFHMQSVIKKNIQQFILTPVILTYKL